MSELDLSKPNRSASTSVASILLVVFAGFFIIGPLIGALIAGPFIEGSFSDFAFQLGQPTMDPSLKTPLFIVQGMTTFIGFIIGPMLYWYGSERQSLRPMFGPSSVAPIVFLMAALVVITFSGPDSVVAEWNSNMSFPGALKKVGEVLRDFEDRAGKMTDYFTSFKSPWEFMVGFFVIAILPGIGEELVFRGMLQPKLSKWTGNAHAGIWISAILFSMLHMQFFGFVPRLLLGALFGYLYLWTGNLAVPMLAHTINNGFSLVVIYLYRLGKLEMDPDKVEALPLPVVATGTILTFALLYYIKKLSPKPASLDHQS